MGLGFYGASQVDNFGVGEVAAIPEPRSSLLVLSVVQAAANVRLGPNGSVVADVVIILGNDFRIPQE